MEIDQGVEFNPIIEGEPPAWVNHLKENGWAIVPGVVSPERCAEYESRFWDWLEHWNTGIDRNDPQSWDEARWPASVHGIYQQYAIGHQQFVWDARCEPAIIDVFSTIWNTKELLVSFDGANFSRPKPSNVDAKPRPHVDQTPNVEGFNCVQGFLNLKKSGPQDGGLSIYEGSHRLFRSFFAQKPNAHQIKNWYRHTPDDLKFFETCPSIKINCDVGDFVIWDSRTIHYGAPPLGDSIRMTIYICMLPRSMATEEDIKVKQRAFEDLRTCSHWPTKTRVFHEKPHRVFSIGVDPRDFPVEKIHPVLTDVGQKLAGLIPY
eukprot:TRINITY_DN5881_c0_g2_i1.p1 TRINITY_DN5881_c0_g2~~TRINITY_DN5881_c0_g2_i1.p1  ORF type:complete len:339 (-),score=65.11 TRINITY_DN5881_c0_g2_i1:30-986(-)